MYVLEGKADFPVARPDFSVYPLRKWEPRKIFRRGGPKVFQISLSGR